jgi:hypothetical protein
MEFCLDFKVCDVTYRVAFRDPDADGDAQARAPQKLVDLIMTSNAPMDITALLRRGDEERVMSYIKVSNLRFLIKGGDEDHVVITTPDLSRLSGIEFSMDGYAITNLNPAYMEELFRTLPKTKMVE